MMDFEGEYQVNFTWDGDIIASKLSSVEVVLAPAKSVWDDHFDENDYHNHTVSYCLQKLENGMFEADIPLKMDTYHFLFRLNGGCDFAASNEYNVTYLANGRKLNYINVGDIVAVLLNNPKFEDKPESDISKAKDGDITSTIEGSARRPSGLKRFIVCCNYC